MTKEAFLKKWYVVQAPEVNEEFRNDVDDLLREVRPDGYHDGYDQGYSQGYDVAFNAS